MYPSTTKLLLATLCFYSHLDYVFAAPVAVEEVVKVLQVRQDDENDDDENGSIASPIRNGSFSTLTVSQNLRFMLETNMCPYSLRLLVPLHQWFFRHVVYHQAHRGRSVSYIWLLSNLCDSPSSLSQAYTSCGHSGRSRRSLQCRPCLGAAGGCSMSQ